MTRSALLLQNQDTPAAVVVIAVLAVGITLVVTALFFRSLRRDSRELALARELLSAGEPAEAKVVRMWNTGTTLNDNPKVKFLLEVRPPRSRPVSGGS